MEKKNIIRVQKDKSNPYVVINKTFLNDTNLSFKAKGLLSYLLSKPDNWTVYTVDLIKSSKDGKDAVVSGLKELKNLGYLEKYSIRDDKGRISHWESIIYEVPSLEAIERNKKRDKKNQKPSCGKSETGEKREENPDTDFPHQEKPEKENPPLINNNLINNDKIYNDNNNNNKKETNNNKATKCRQETKSVTDKEKNNNVDVVETFQNLISKNKDNPVSDNKLIKTIIKEGEKRGVPIDVYIAELMVEAGNKNKKQIIHAVSAAAQWAKDKKINNWCGVLVRAVIDQRKPAPEEKYCISNKQKHSKYEDLIMNRGG